MISRLSAATDGHPSGTAESAAGSHSRLSALDGVRAASILLVLLAHTAPLGPKALELNAAVALMGMSLFFSLSGFLIASILHSRPNVFEFYVKRIFRIVPAVYLYIALLVAFFGLPLQNAWPHLLFVSNYVQWSLSEGPVGHLWSLCVEMQYYVAIGLVVLCFGRRGLWLVFPAAVVITFLRVDAGANTNIMTHVRVDEILAGSCLAMLMMTHRNLMTRLFSPTAVTVLGLGLVIPLWIAASHTHFGPLMYARPYLGALLICIALHSQVAVLNRILGCSVARYIAQISYALYIYHPLMIFGAMNTGSDYLRYLVRRPISYLLTWAAAHLSTFYWESYWQRLAQQIIRGREGRIESTTVEAEA